MPRRSIVTLVLIADLAALLLARVVVDRDTPAVGAQQPIGAVNTEPITLNSATSGTSRANIEAHDEIDVALDDLERALQAAADEELDVIAAARLPEIVRRDARKAARFVELHSASQQRQVLIRHLSRLWGENDAESALAWAQALPDVTESNLARRAACLALGQTNPAAAIERCVHDDAEDTADLQGMFQSWAQSDLAAAGEWLDAQPASARRDTLRHRYIHVLARTNLEEALRRAQEEFSVAADRDEAVLTVLHQWALQDLHAARQWVENNAPDELRARSLAEIEGLESYAAGR